MTDPKKRYQVWSSVRGIERLYSSFELYDQAYDLMIKLHRQYPRTWRFYIRDSKEEKNDG